MYKRSILALIALVLILAACAPAATTQAPAAPREAAPQTGGRVFDQSKNAGGAPAVAVPAAPGAAPAGYNPAGGDSSAAPADRLVIQNADMSIVVDAPDKVMDAVAKMAADMKGFVVTSNLYKTRTENGEEVPQANITIRVPAGKLDEALAKIRGLTRNPTEDVRSENRSGQDVTKEYTDLQSRLKNLEDTEAQLREIMASATKTEDVMSVFNQLTQIREQIEVTKGQIKYYEESAALSAINLQIVASASVAPLTIGGWKPAGVARDALQTLINTLKFLANLLIWLVIYVLPVLLIIGIPVAIVIALVRRGRKNRNRPAPPAPVDMK